MSGIQNIIARETTTDRDRGAAEKTIDFWIDKLLNAGDIVEPDDGFYRR